MDKKYKSQDGETGLMMTLWLRDGNVSKSGCDLPLGRLVSCLSGPDCVYQDLTDLPGSRWATEKDEEESNNHSDNKQQHHS